MPPSGRLISAGMVAAGAFGLLINHFMSESLGVGRLMILCLAPVAFFLGLGGIVEPKIVWSVGKFSKYLPASYKLTGGILGGLGVTVTILLLMFVYRLVPPERQDPPPSRFARRQTGSRPNLVQTVSSAEPATSTEPAAETTSQQETHAAAEIKTLTYDRPSQRWVPMDAEALQSVRREDMDGVTTLHYVKGKHALLKVLWPDVLEIGDRFSVGVRGANSVELVDLERVDANTRTSAEAGDGFVTVEFCREADGIRVTCDGQTQQPYYASGKLRGDEARLALLATEHRPAFTAKRETQASFRNAQTIRPLRPALNGRRLFHQ